MRSSASGIFDASKRVPGPDVQGPRIGDGKRPAGQKCNAVTDLVGLKPLEICRRRRNLRKPARRFLELVAEGGKVGKVH